eukprot:GFUD01010670.1.p1 GENE.GFUD01010670.1~~GFUD01010670.1.p1  ORF type:complete len:193 (-),score=79.82 GFUD01010670.1:91-669(-)
MSGKPSELLEPRLTSEASKDRMVRNMLHGRPEIQRLGRSSVLDEVRSFLPQMAEAEVKLAAALAGGDGRQFDVENVTGDQRVIEMDIAMVQDRSGSSSPDIRLSGTGPASPTPAWTSDSEPDSTPSPSENSYTSDTDISSSSTCSSSSCDESSPARKAAPPPTRKRPLIQELDPVEDQAQCKTSQSKTPRQS